MTGGTHYIPSHTNVCKFSTYVFSADITPEMLKLGRLTKVKVFFLVLVYIFNIDLFEFSATILEKGLLRRLFSETPQLNLSLSIKFSNSLIIHQVKTKKITTVKEVWIPGLN